MRPSQPALNASTPKGNAPAISPGSTSSCVMKPRQSGERPSVRSSCSSNSRTKHQNCHHPLNPHIQTNLDQLSSTPEATLPVPSLSAIHPMSRSPGCSTISPSSRPSVPSSSISSSSRATRTASKAISSTCFLCMSTLLLIRPSRWPLRRWL